MRRNREVRRLRHACGLSERRIGAAIASPIDHQRLPKQCGMSRHRSARGWSRSTTRRCIGDVSVDGFSGRGPTGARLESRAQVVEALRRDAAAVGEEQAPRR